MRTAFACAALWVLCFTARAVAESAPRQDPDDAVFTASDIVIVSAESALSFKVERNYRGNLAVGSKIELPKFKLVRFNELQDAVPVVLTVNTRILLFLRAAEKDPTALEITGYGYAFFYRDVAKIDELDAIAKQALAVHSKWIAARDLPDRQERVRALFPYLLDWRPKARDYQHSDRSCRTLTLAELAKLKPESGDYLATQLSKVSAREREHLLLDIRELQSPRAHAAAIACVDGALARFKVYLADHNLKSIDVRSHWADLSEEAQHDYTVIYYGLSAVASFNDAGDIPYVKSLIPALLAGNLERPLDACIGILAAHPAAENVPLLLSIWKDYQPTWQAYKADGYPITNAPSVPLALARAMAAHKDPAAIPAMLEMLQHPQWEGLFAYELRQLTGQSLATRDEWNDWYADQAKPAKAKPALKPAR